MATVPNGQVDNPAGPLRENKTSDRFGYPGNLIPFVQPGAVDQTSAPYNHDSNVVSGYKGVSPEYRTYADARDKPTASTLFTIDEPGNLLGGPEAAAFDSPQLSGPEGKLDGDNGNDSEKAPAKKAAPAKAAHSSDDK